MRIWPGLLAAILAVNSASGQANLLERWTADYIHLGWTPSWMMPDADWSFPKDRDYRVALGSAVDRVSLGNGAAMSHGRSWVRIQQPLGSSQHIFRAGVSQYARGMSLNAENPFLRTPFNLSLDVGFESRWGVGRLGEVALSAVGAWDRGPSWSVGLLSSSTVHRIQVMRWRTRARPLTLALPTDSVTDVAVENALHSTLLEAHFEYPVGAIRPSIGLSLEKHDAKQESIGRETFLSLSPGGSLERLDLSFAIEARAAGAGVKHRRQDGDLDGQFLRRDAPVGKLFFGRSRFTQWALEVWRMRQGARWSFQIGVDESNVAMSARLDTWPFVALWEQLGATAFRYRGSLSGNTQWVRFERMAGPSRRGSISWAASAGLHQLKTSQQDWLVTSLGFGRAEQDSTGTSIDPAVIIGMEASRSFRVTSGDLRLFLSAALPVYADTDGESMAGTGGKSMDRGAIPGQIRLGASWWYRD